MKFKTNDYVRFMERPGVFSRGWIDHISRDRLSCDVQVDDNWLGHRGLTIRCSYVKEVLPEKERPLVFWKQKACVCCDKQWDCDYINSVKTVPSDCTYATELVVAGAIKVD